MSRAASVTLDYLPHVTYEQYAQARQTTEESISFKAEATAFISELAIAVTTPTVPALQELFQFISETAPWAHFTPPSKASSARNTYFTSQLSPQLNREKIEEALSLLEESAPPSLENLCLKMEWIHTLLSAIRAQLAHCQRA